MTDNSFTEHLDDNKMTVPVYFRAPRWLLEEFDTATRKHVLGRSTVLRLLMLEYIRRTQEEGAND